MCLRRLGRQWRYQRLGEWNLKISTIQIPRHFVEPTWECDHSTILHSSRILTQWGHPSKIFTSATLADQRSHSVESGIEVRRFSTLNANGEGDSLAEELLREKAALYHLHTDKRIASVACWAARLQAIPYVISLPERPSLDRSVRDLYRGAAAVLCPTRAQCELVTAIEPLSKVKVLPPGIEEARYQQGHGRALRQKLGIPEHRVVVGVIGSLQRSTGHHLAVEALARLGDPNLHLLITGQAKDPAYAQDLQGALSLNQVSANILPALLGQALIEAYQACDILLIPSLEHAFGHGCLEGWAARRPVVAAETGGLRELIRHGRDGLLFTPGDTVHLARQLGLLIRDQELKKRLVLHGRESVGKYRWDSHTQSLLEIYREALQTHRDSSIGHWERPSPPTRYLSCC